jgi:hypothetical protein
LDRLLWQLELAPTGRTLAVQSRAQHVFSGSCTHAA